MLNFLKKKKINNTIENISTNETTLPIDISEQEFLDLYELCKPYTMTSPERMYSLYKAVQYILVNNIEGDFIECGVWKGGSALLIASILCKKGITNRKVILYDTYEGMSEPTENDKDYLGKKAEVLLKETSIEIQDSVWCYSSFEEVKANLNLSGLQKENIIMIKGKVEDTIPNQLPTNKIALLRLDTDWYESTKHELNYLYPLLQHNGVLIIDDYGHWEGCRKAVDEYFSFNKISILLNRIDNTGRIAIKNI
jgi:O-methyltransferase